MMTERIAMNEYPPFLGTVEVVLGWLPVYGWFIGEDVLFDRAKKTSRMKLEKEVREPQNPVVKPMYKGIDFLTLPWRALDGAEKRFSLPSDGWCVIVCVPHSPRNKRWSSLK